MKSKKHPFCWLMKFMFNHHFKHNLFLRKPSLQFHEDSLFGHAVYTPSLLSNGILTFIIVCPFGGLKFVCKMMAVRQLDTQFPCQETQHLITTLKNAGEFVIAITFDGNRFNQSFFKLFDTKPSSMIYFYFSIISIN